MELPDFCVKKAEQEFVAGDAGEAGGGEGGLGVGEVGDAEAGEDAEGEVEGADVEGGEGAEEWALGDGEVGEEPEGAGGGVGGDVLGEGGEFGLGEAVEEEVGDDEVGVAGYPAGVEGRGWKQVQRPRSEGSDALDVRLAAVAEEVEHGGAGIDGEGAEVRPSWSRRRARKRPSPSPRTRA